MPRMKPVAKDLANQQYIRWMLFCGRCGNRKRPATEYRGKPFNHGFRCGCDGLGSITFPFSVQATEGNYYERLVFCIQRSKGKELETILKEALKAPKNTGGIKNEAK